MCNYNRAPYSGHWRHTRGRMTWDEYQRRIALVALAGKDCLCLRCEDGTWNRPIERWRTIPGVYMCNSCIEPHSVAGRMLNDPCPLNLSDAEACEAYRMWKERNGDA